MAAAEDTGPTRQHKWERELGTGRRRSSSPAGGERAGEAQGGGRLPVGRGANAVLVGGPGPEWGSQGLGRQEEPGAWPGVWTRKGGRCPELGRGADRGLDSGVQLRR